MFRTSRKSSGTGRGARSPLFAARECLRDASRHLEQGGVADLATTEERFREAVELLRSCRTADAQEAIGLQQDARHAGELLKAIGAWQQKLAALISAEDTALPGYGANGQTQQTRAANAVAVLG